MKSEKTTAMYRRLREQSLWRLLAAANGPIIIALLQTHLLEEGKSMPASIFQERIHRDLEALRAQGNDFPQTSQAYIADWLSSGYLERHFPAGMAEEEYELSTQATHAIRFVMTLVKPRATATESRLATVMQQLVRLSEETDNNPQSRIASLQAERDRIDQEILAIKQGKFKPLTKARALERSREIIGLADELTSDFRRVRDQFQHLNRQLREHVIDNEGSRGDVLDALFAGVDVIANSDAGKTFSAFWNLLIDPVQSAALDQAIDQVLTRDFAAQLDSSERRFLLRLTRILLEQGGEVHEVLQHFARSLKHFVQSREYLEQRRVNQLLKEAQRTALALKEDVKITDSIEYTLQLTSIRLVSYSQWILFDPMINSVQKGMTKGEGALIDLASVGALVSQSEIDFRHLKSHIREILQQRDQASIAEILEKFPAAQGLGSVIGYLALGSSHGVRINQLECIKWQDKETCWRHARIPTIYFLREKSHELL